MTTYNTGNPIGSTDARDLYDNAQNLDNFANGSAASYTDRLGVSRRSLAGIDAAADNVLNGIGYAVPVAYASGISMTLTSQTVEYAGEIYAPKSSALPFTTSSWGADSAKFRLIIASDASRVNYTPAGTGAVATTVQTKLRETVSVEDFGAVLDGVTNDASALYNANAAAIAANVPLLINGTMHIGTATTITAPIVDGLHQMFSVTSNVTINNGLPVRPEWFGNNMAKTLAAIPSSGGTLLLSDVVYPPFGTPVRRNNISIIGTRLPKFKADYTGLESGSIIQGPFDFRGDDITLDNFGVDSGSAVCASLYGGTAQEGFLSGLPVATRSKRLHATRLIAICKEPTALTHAFALEGYTNSEVHQLEAVYGVHGIAIKMTDSNMSNLKARGCAYDGVIIKSDTSETTSERLNVQGIYCGSIGTYDGAGLRITNSTGNQVLVGINIKNVTCNRTVYGIDFDCNDTHLIDSVNIDGAFFFVCQTYGFRNMGMARRCKMSNAVAYNCGAQGFLTAKAVGAGSGDTQPEIDFDSCIASNCSTGFEMYGRNKVSNCWSNFNTYYGFYAASGSRVSRIACVAASNGTSPYGPVGAIFYPGNSAAEATAATLQNGWQNYGTGKEIASFYLTDDGVVKLTGLIKLGTVGSTIFQLPVGYRPKNELWFLCSSLSGAALTPAHVVVGADGTVVAQADAGNAFLSLDGISFRMDLT